MLALIYFELWGLRGAYKMSVKEAYDVWSDSYDADRNFSELAQSLHAIDFSEGMLAFIERENKPRKAI